MDEVIANILHHHNYFTDQETECAGKFIDVPENLKHILHDHNYIRHIFNPETIKYTDLNWCAEVLAETDDYVIYDTTEEAREMDVIEETLYPEEKFQDNVYMFQGNVQNILGSSTLNRTVKLNFSTNEANRHPICRADSRGLSRPVNFEQISGNNNGFNHTLNSNVIQMNNKIMGSLYNIERLTNLTSIKTTKTIEDQSVLSADKTMLDSDASIIMFDHSIKQDKDCDVYDPEMTVETLSTSMVDDLTSAGNIKIEECVLEWNDKKIDSSCMGEDIVRSEIKSDWCIEEDCDVYDPEMTVETLSTSMLDDLTSASNIKIEECVLEWNDKNIDSSYMGEDIVRSEIKSDSYIVEEDSEVAYTNLILCKYCNEGFKTSELKLKHECVCKCARRLVIELRREVEATRPKKPRKNALNRDQESCRSGIEVWKNKKEKTAEMGKSSRVQKKEEIDEKRFACDYCSFKTKYKDSLKRHCFRRHKDRIQMKEDTDKKILLACVHCSFKTEHKAYLERHTSEHYKDNRVQGKEPIINEERWFACIHCNFKSKWRGSVKHHMQIKHSNTVFKCYHCNYSFREKPGLIYHLLKYREKRKYRCSRCSFVSYCRPALRAHVKYKHKTRNDCEKIQCPHCPSIFASKYNVGDHILQKHPEFSDSVTQKIHKCSFCMFQTTYKIHLRDHLMKHSDVKPYECEMCGYKTKWRTRLDHHILKSCRKKVQEKKPINETSWFKCIHCDYKSEWEASVNRHMQMDHGNSMQMKHSKTGFICYHCDHSFYRKRALVYHLLKYREKKQYRCGKCSFMAYCRPALRTHVKYEHKTKKEREKFQCPHCPSIFASKYNVGDHILQKHPEFSDSVTQKIHKCSICMFQTTYKIHLRDHLLKHSDVKPYECEMCGYKTKWKTQLDRHIIQTCRKK